MNFHKLHPIPEVLSKKEAGKIIQQFKDAQNT
jgi:hypothetical protein